MKKIIALALAAMLIVPVLSGCGSSNSSKTASDQKITLTFWTHVDNVWNKQHDKIIAEFEKANPNITVKRSSFPYDDFQSKVQSSLTTSSGADIYQIWGGWGVDFDSTGAFAQVPNDFISKIKKDSYAPVLGSFEYNGKYYGIPLEYNIEYGGMLVDVNMFKERGISYPTTWNDMIKIATKYSKSSGATFKVRGFDFPAWDAMTYIWTSMILSSGGQYIKNKQFDFESPIGIKTMQQLVNYVKVDKMTNLDGITNADEEEPYQKFYHMNEALMVPRGPWVVPEGHADYGLTYGKDFKYVAMPFYGKKQAFAAETGWGLAVNAKSKNQAAAWKFIEFWSQKDRMLDFNIAAGMVPAYKSIAHDPKLLQKMPYLKPLIPILDKGQYIGYFNTDTLKGDVCDMYVDIINNGTPVDKAVKALDKKLNKEITTLQ